MKVTKPAAGWNRRRVDLLAVTLSASALGRGGPWDWGGGNNSQGSPRAGAAGTAAQAVRWAGVVLPGYGMAGVAIPGFGGAVSVTRVTDTGMPLNPGGCSLRR